MIHDTSQITILNQLNELNWGHLNPPALYNAATLFIHVCNPELIILCRYFKQEAPAFKIMLYSYSAEKYLPETSVSIIAQLVGN